MPRMTQTNSTQPRLSKDELSAITAQSKKFKQHFFTKDNQSVATQIQLLINHCHLLLTYHQNAVAPDSLNALFSSEQMTRLNIDLVHAVGAGQANYQDVFSHIENTLKEVNSHHRSGLLKQYRPFRQYLNLLQKALNHSQRKLGKHNLCLQEKQKLLSIKFNLSQ